MTSSYPLQWPDGWPRTADYARRRNSSFRTTFDKAKRDLMAEIGRMRGRGVVISSWLAVRGDGTPYADQARRRIPDPGVAVYFTRGKRQMVMARDVWDTPHDNLRSIGLAIEHLRGLERHGGATMMDRAFEGFAALPPPGPVKRAWWEVLEIPPDSAPFMIEAAYRHHAKSKHPDGGGSVEQFQELQDAFDQAKKDRGQ